MDCRPETTALQSTASISLTTFSYGCQAIVPLPSGFPYSNGETTQPTPSVPSYSCQSDLVQAVTAAEAEDAAGEQQEMGISKKEPLVRIQELLGQGNGSLAQGLALLASQKGSAMLRHAAASDVAVEIARGGEHGETILPPACASITF